MKEAHICFSDAGRIDAALTLFLRLRRESPSIPSHRLALQAVDTVYCTLLELASESAFCHLTPRREDELATAVLRRAGLGAWQLKQEPAQDRVERASEQSFPSSDPPAWIWGHPDPPPTTDFARPAGDDAFHADA